MGDFRDGRWTTLERIAWEPGKTQLPIDADRATCLILLCPATEEPMWTGRLTEAMLRPDKIVGY